MDAEDGHFSEFCTAQSSDAGNGNKMASSSETLNRIKTVEHELKIMEVEGAVSAEPPIEVEDGDIDVDSVPLVNELQTALIANTDIENRDPLQDERLSAKVEPTSDDESAGSYNGPDPMGLLERMDSTQEIDDDEEEEESDADEGSSNGSRRINRSERWQIWMKRWSWLLHEESDGDYAFCLYCNVVLNVNKKLKYIQQHNLSLYHQERENNYLAFKKSDKQASDCANEVKYEFGSNNYVAAMKHKRGTEVEALNNFNWERWLKWHSWLERIQSAGTIGLCKCCNVRMNVEFVYLRKRHETSKGHCEARRQQDNSSRKRKRSVSLDETSADNVPEQKNSAKKTSEDLTLVTMNDSSVGSEDPSDWCEMLPGTKPQQCRCTLCDVRMSITSFMRHLKTKVHCHNLNSQNKNSQNKVDRGIWAQYADKHPWLVADPNDPNLAYCHVCCRRFIYGHSEIKRKNHENSENHQARLAASAVAEGDESVSDDKQSEAEKSEAHSENEDSDDDYAEKDDTLSTSKKSSVSRKEAATKTNKVKLVVRQYSWLRYSKDRRLQFCKYCRLRFYSESSKLAHHRSEQHKRNMQKFKSQKGEKYKAAKKTSKMEIEEKDKDEDEDEEEQSNNESEGAADIDGAASSKSDPTPKASSKADNKSGPTTMQGKVRLWRSRFPWMSYKRNEPRQNYGWCKLCDVSVFMPSFKFASKHQRSSRHIRLRFERKRAEEQQYSGGTSMATATAAALATGEAKHKAAMAELQAKYKWLEPDTIDENHCRCKHCDTRLPIKVFYLRQHDGSRKHIENMEQFRKDCETRTMESSREQTEGNRMDVDQDSDEALSVNRSSFRSECSTEEQALSKRSRRTMELRRILRALRGSSGKRQEERSHMDMARDMICSSFDIVKRLRTLERETDLRELPSSSIHHQHTNVVDSQSQRRDTIDLFFDSITQTMKSLPADLAAEGKAKIMQVVCNLELRSMQRTAASPLQTETQTQSKAATDISPPTRRNSSHVNKGRLNIEDVIDAVDSPESETSSVIFEEPSDEYSTQLQTPYINNNSNEVSHLAEITLSSTQRTEKPSPSPPTTTTTVPSPAPTVINGMNKEVPVNIRRILPSTVQIGTKSESVDQLRVVPINKLTSPKPNLNNNIRNNLNGSNSTTTPLNRNGQSQKLVSPNRFMISTPPNSSSHSDMINGTTSSNAASTTVFHKIRVSNGTSTKVIRFQQNPQLTPHHTPQQSAPHRLLNEQQKLPVRYSSGGSNPNSSANLSHGQGQSQTQAHIQAQAQAQLRALSANRQVVRTTTAHRPSQQ